MDAGKRIRGLAAAVCRRSGSTTARIRSFSSWAGRFSRAPARTASCAKAQTGGPAGQSGVWAEVARANDEAGVSSSTGAYQDAYRDGRVSRKIEELERELADLARRHPQAVGAIVGLGGSIVSLDLFADPHLFRSTALVARGQ